MAGLRKRAAAAWRALTGAGERAFYSGAQGSRLVADWAFQPMASAKDIYKADGERLRARAREMVRNDPTFARYTRLMADQVIGPDGIHCEPRLYDRDGTLLKDDSDRLCEEFEHWGRRETCSRDGRLSWQALLYTCVQLRPTDGDVFVLMVPAANRWGLSLQLVDADLVRHDLCTERTRDGNEIANGIELDRDGRPVAYYLWTDYTKRETRRVTAEWMLHYYRMRRPGEYRGVTDFAPVMMLSRMLHGYREAEVVAARLAATKLGAIKMDPEYGPSVTAEESKTNPIPTDAAPGSFWNLLPGQEVQMFDPQHPTEAFADFVKSVKGDIAAGLGHAYVTLFGDWSATNYSSGRMPVLQERDHYAVEQRLIIDTICRPVYERWLQLAWLRGVVELPTQDWREHTDAVWQPRTWPMFDPKQEVEVAKAQLDLRLTTRGRLSAAMGLDWQDTIEQTAAEQKLAAKYGVDLSTESVAEAVKTTAENANGNGTTGAASGQ